MPADRLSAKTGAGSIGPERLVSSTLRGALVHEARYQLIRLKKIPRRYKVCVYPAVRLFGGPAPGRAATGRSLGFVWERDEIPWGELIAGSFRIILSTTFQAAMQTETALKLSFLKTWIRFKIKARVSQESLKIAVFIIECL